MQDYEFTLHLHAGAVNDVEDFLLWLKYRLSLCYLLFAGASLWKTITVKAPLCLWRNSVAVSTNSSTETNTRTEEEPKAKLPPRRPSSLQLCIIPHISITWHAGPLTTPEQTPSSCTCSRFTVDAPRLWCTGGRGFEAKLFQCVWYATSNKPYKVALWSSVRLSSGMLKWSQGRESFRSCYMTFCVCLHSGLRHIWGERRLKCW